MYDTDQNPLLDRLLKSKPPSVTDLGAGLGKHTGYLLERGCKVEALDRVITPQLREIAALYADRCILTE